jgi:hypothetical protein
MCGLRLTWCSAVSSRSRVVSSCAPHLAPLSGDTTAPRCSQAAQRRGQFQAERAAAGAGHEQSARRTLSVRRSAGQCGCWPRPGAWTSDHTQLRADAYSCHESRSQPTLAARKAATTRRRESAHHLRRREYIGVCLCRGLPASAQYLNAAACTSRQRHK